MTIEDIAKHYGVPDKIMNKPNMTRLDNPNPVPISELTNYDYEQMLLRAAAAYMVGDRYKLIGLAAIIKNVTDLANEADGGKMMY